MNLMITGFRFWFLKHHINHYRIRDLYVDVDEVMGGSPRVLTPDAVTGLYLLKMKEVSFLMQSYMVTGETSSGS